MNQSARGTGSGTNTVAPIVSIITPAFNSGAFIDETIRSVVAQTYENWEMLIVDDCSTDDTVSKVSAWQEVDTRVKLLRNETNSGPGTSRNRAVENAQGRYVADLDRLLETS